MQAKGKTLTVRQISDVWEHLHFGIKKKTSPQNFWQTKYMSQIRHNPFTLLNIRNISESRLLYWKMFSISSSVKCFNSKVFSQQLKNTTGSYF